MAHPERPAPGEDPRPPTDDADDERELTRRRAQALAVLDERKVRRFWPSLVPILVILGIWLALEGTQTVHPHVRIIPLHGYEVVLTGPSSPAFYRRLRFYRWLARDEKSRS